MNRQQPTGIGLVIFYPFAYRRMCTTEHFFTAIQARKKVPNSGIDRLHNYSVWKCLKTIGVGKLDQQFLRLSLTP